MQVENYFGSPLTEEEMQIQSCVADPHDAHGHQQPKDYSAYLNFVAIYMVRSFTGASLIGFSADRFLPHLTIVQNWHDGSRILSTIR